jgi:hypothetical protein
MRGKRLKLNNKELIERSRAQTRLLVETDIQPGQMTPLAYLLMVINDPTVDSDRRDRLAIAAAPYCHPKLMERHTVGKKDQRAEAAEQAGMGTPWAQDLDLDTHVN